jgi:universal stress protein E
LWKTVLPLRKEGINVSGRQTWGTPFLEITREVQRSAYGLVVKTAQGGSRLGSPMFGTTAQHLLRKCPSRVWLVAPGHNLLPRRILAVIDPDPDAPLSSDLDRRVLETSLTLGRTYGADVEVIHPYYAIGEGAMRQRASAVDVSEYPGSLQTCAERSVARCVEAWAPDLPPDKVHLRKGVAAEVVADLVALHDIDLVVVGTVPPGRLAGLLIHGDAESIVNSMSCSVLALKPSDYVSPLPPLKPGSDGGGRR